VSAAPTRLATTDEAGEVARLLDAFNREFDTPTPGVDVLTGRLRTLLAGDQVVAVLAGEPAVAVALLTLRPNVWYDGPVGLLDELYVAPGRRGAGIGTELLHAVEALVRHRGGELLEINVDGEDHDTRRFYERHGYRCVEPAQEEPALYYFREFA
jgi:GNAT superfamily N-acetyltransferase